MSFRRALWGLGALLLLALNCAAWQDILKGEQDVWLEWTLVIVSLLLGIAYLARKWRERMRTP
jgi:membrane protein DedA with SNARE-associated domain